MKTLAHIVSALLAASTLLVPLSAMAEGKAKNDSFPMKAEVFKKLVDGKLDKMKGHLDKGMSKRSMTSEQKADIEKTMESATKDLHAVVEKVGADGVVTKDEAKQVKELSDKLRSKVREQLKGKHASSKAKGQKPKAKSRGKALSKKAASNN